MNLCMSNISKFGFAICKFKWGYPNVCYACDFFISASTNMLDMWRFQTEEWEVVMCRTSRINCFSKDELILFALVGKHTFLFCMIFIPDVHDKFSWRMKLLNFTMKIYPYIDPVITYIARVHLLEYRDFFWRFSVFLEAIHV